MPPDRLALILATLCFLGGFGYAAYMLGARKNRVARANILVMGAGFICQTTFLYLRGEQVGRCPLTNLAEVLIFVSWSVVLLYLVIGPAFRLSLLGVFTAPLVFAFHFIALLLPARLSTPQPIEGHPDFWLEIHASVSLMAYGAFALACIAGIMYLIQDRLLKRQNLNELFFSLPPVHHLSQATVRLVAVGFILLTIGIAAAYGMENRPTGLKLALSYAVWALYGAIIATNFLHKLSSKKIARIAVLGFLLPVFTLWIVSKH